MKVKFNFNLNAWICDVETEGKSYEEALENLYKMSFEELVEAGYCRESSISDIDGVIVEKTVRVKAYDIDYNIEEEDYDSPEDYVKIINSLPDELVLEILLEPSDDLEEMVADEITYKTGWLVNQFNYTVLEEY